MNPVYQPFLCLCLFHSLRSVAEFPGVDSLCNGDIDKVICMIMYLSQFRADSSVVRREEASASAADAPG